MWLDKPMDMHGNVAREGKRAMQLLKIMSEETNVYTFAEGQGRATGSGRTCVL
jgi:hypothetical protein